MFLYLDSINIQIKGPNLAFSGCLQVILHFLSESVCCIVLVVKRVYPQTNTNSQRISTIFLSQVIAFFFHMDTVEFIQVYVGSRYI